VCVFSEPTAITTLPSTLDITVGESVVLPCQVSHDPSLELKFTWFFNEQLIHFGSHGGYFEKVGGVSLYCLCVFFFLKAVLVLELQAFLLRRSKIFIHDVMIAEAVNGHFLYLDKEPFSE